MAKSLTEAKRNKNDEFYTQITDIEKEMKHYTKHFKDKIIYLNCDDPTESNFWKFFSLNFKHLGLKKLIATHFHKDKPTYKLELFEYGVEPIKTDLKQNGDFRSDESIELLKESDIVVTNPPFSLFREYIAQLMEYDKKFIVLGNVNAITYKGFWPYMKEQKIWIGESIRSGDREFRVPDSYPLNAAGNRIDEYGNKYIRVKGVRWFTNLPVPRMNEEIILWKEYNPEEYPKYDNYNAINVDKVKEIPKDYNGLMGVPITFMDKFNPNQFEIVHFRKGDDGKFFRIGERIPYARIIIRRKDNATL